MRKEPRKINIPILSFFILLFLLLCVFVFSDRTVKVENLSAVEAYIEAHSGYSDVTICRTEKRGEYFAITYYDASSPESNYELMVLKRALLPLPGRYSYFGGASSTQEIDTFNFNQGGETSLIIVYGGAPGSDLAAYSFENCGRCYYASLGDSPVLDIYILENSSNPSAHLAFYDSEGNVVE